ncbi:MAG TPA: choice-of-anchor Q domain-containing protein, partial [Thermomicrobiaceae bacterium]|nr:choice-of-anchor Q domain-containing protein [Thermomicrobiaceae bacterium]
MRRGGRVMGSRRRWWRPAVPRLAGGVGVLVLLLGAAMVGLGLPSGARAASITVNSTADNGPGNCTSTCTLRDAVATSSSGDTIDFSVTGTITLTQGEITVPHDLTITGPGARTLAITSNGQSRVFFNGGSALTVSGLTFTDNTPSSSEEFANHGGAIYSFGTLNVKDSTFTNNSASTAGGALYNSGTLNAADSTFSGNTAPFAAAIQTQNFAVAYIAASTFSDNHGSVDVVRENGSSSSDLLYITNSTFSGDTGNAVGEATGAATTLTNSIVNDSGCGSGLTGTNNLAPASCPGSIGTVTGLDTALANNGGPTDTFDLIQPSNAIDAASSCSYPAAFTASIFDATKDQRGLARPVGSACDIGAVEAFQFTPAALPSGTFQTSYSQAIAVSAGGSGSYTYTETGSLPNGVTLSTGGSLAGTPTQAGTFPVTAKTTDSNGFVGEAAYPLTINAAGTTTAPANATATFSAGNQAVTLSATVTTPAGTVNEGTVTFTVTDATNTVVGTATTSGTVTSGAASVSYTLPGGTPAGSYTITATYHDAAGNFTDSSGTATLTISAAITVTTATSASATFSTTDQTVTLAATVTSPAGAVNEGTVTFTVTDATNTQVGTAVTSGTVSGGSASASFTLPGNTPAGSYTITAVYNPGPDFTGSQGTNTLAVNAAGTTTSPNSATAQDSATSVTLSATVTSPAGTVNAGSVTFTVTDASNTMVGTATSGNVSNGSASVSYGLPGTLAPRSYTITAAYHDAAGNFGDSSGTSTLTITPGPPASLTLAPGGTTATVGTTLTETATVEDALGYPVADGTTVDFTVSGITNTTGSATTTNGQASF